MRPSSPSAYCSKITTVTPSTDGAYLWKDFLDMITEGDESLQRFLQIYAGSASIGKIYHEGIAIAIGCGANGKSTFYNTLAAVLGDYSCSVDVNILTTDRSNKGPLKATLRGRRLVICGELEEGQRLSVQNLKQLASTDMLVIEEKYKQPEVVKPSHHITMFSNYLPRVGSTDQGTWRRLQLVPFQATIPAGSAKPNYSDKLVKDAGGAVLNWIVEGARMFFEDGCRLNPPAVVVEATARYRQQEDWLRNFIEEECLLDDQTERKGLWIFAGELYQAYKDYAVRSNIYCRSLPDFNRAMEAADFRKVGVAGGKKKWLGIALAAKPVLTSAQIDALSEGE